MNCPHCGQQHPQFAAFCPQTGIKLQNAEAQNLTYKTQDFCVECGTPNKEGYTFCKSCGTNLQSTVVKKGSLDQLIGQSISSLPNVASTIKEQVTKEAITDKTKEIIATAKAKPMMLVAAIIPIVLTLLFAFFISGKIKDNSDLIDEIADFNFSSFFDEDDIKDMFEDGYDDYKIDAESFPMVSTVVGLMHNGKYTIQASDSIEDDEGGSTFKLTYFLLILPILSIIIGAIVYGVLAKKHNWSLQHGVIFITAAYTIFMVIIAFFSRFNISVSYVDYYEGGKGKAEISGTFPFFSLVVAGFVLSFILSFGVIYFMLNRQTIFKVVNQKVSVAQLAFYAIATTAVGIVVQVIISTLLATKEFKQLIEEIFYDETSNIVSFLIKISTAAASWGVSLFGTFEMTEFEGRSSDSENIGEEIFTNKVFLIIITLAILVTIGYLVAKHVNLSIQQMVIYAVIFALLQIVFVAFTGIEVYEFEGRSKEGGSIGFSYMPVVIGAFVLSFAGMYGGQFLKNNKKA